LLGFDIILVISIRFIFSLKLNSPYLIFNLKRYPIFKEALYKIFSILECLLRICLDT